MNELQTLNERIAERVGESLVDLIPKDDWQAIVDKEVLNFKNEVLPKIILEELTKMHKEFITNYIGSLTMTDWDNETQQHVAKKLEKFIGDSGGVIVASMLAPAMQMVLQDLRNRLY